MEVREVGYMLLLATVWGFLIGFAREMWKDRAWWIEMWREREAWK